MASASLDDGQGGSQNPSDAEKNQTTVVKLGAENHPHVKFNDMRRGKIIVILLSLGLASFLYAIEQTIVATSISTIGTALHTTGSLTWITTSYLLTTTVFQPITGRLADAVGAKRLLVVEVWVFIVGNIIAGTSSNLTQLVVGRLISGVGGAGLLSLATILVSHLTNERQRGSYLNFVNLVFSVADAAGPIVGGGFSKSGNWRWIFLFNAPCGPIITFVLLWALRNTGAGAPLSSASTEVPSIHNKIEKLDFPGMVTLVAALTFLTVALNLGGQSRPWGSPTIIGMFCAAAVMTVAFVVAEKYAREPVAPMRYFAQWRWRNVPLIIVIRTLLFFHLYSLTFYLPLFLQVIGVSPINAGALIIPFLSMAAISSTVSTYFSHRTGLLRSPFIGALAVLPVGMGLMSTLDETALIGRVVGYALICGFGFGCGTQTSMVIAQAGLPSKELSTVTALVGSTPSLGGVLGVGIIGTIINNSFRASFVRSVGAATAASLSLNDVVKLVENTPPGVPREVVVQAYVHAWRIGCRVLAGVAVAQVLLALLLSSVEMDSAQNEGSTEAN